jgi:hypothetical protein
LEWTVLKLYNHNRKNQGFGCRANQAYKRAVPCHYIKGEQALQFFVPVKPAGKLLHLIRKEKMYMTVGTSLQTITVFLSCHNTILKKMMH